MYGLGSMEKAETIWVCGRGSEGGRQEKGGIE